MSNPYAPKSSENLARIKQEISEIKLDFPPVVQFPKEFGDCELRPRATRPRVMVNSDGLEAVIKNLSSEENAPVFERVKGTAEAALLNSGIIEGEASNFKPEYLEELESLAFMYLITKEEIYGYGAVLHALNFIKTIKFIKDAPRWSSTEYQENNKAGTSLFMLAETYDWCYELFTPEQRDMLVRGACQEIAPVMESGYPPVPDCAVTGHGSEPIILRNWLSFSIAIADEYPDIYDCIGGRIMTDYVKAPNWFFKSGVHHQGSSYGNSPRLYPHIACDMLMYAATGVHIYDVSFEPVIMTFLNRIRPDGEPVRVGDDFNCDGAVYSLADIKAIAFFGGSYYKNPVAKAWYKSGKQSFNYGGHCPRTPVTYLLFNDPDIVVTDEDKYKLKRIHYNGSPSGSVVCRSKWNDENAWLTYTNIEEAYAANHDHKDAGTFQIYYKGILAPDAGVYEYGYVAQGFPCGECAYGSPYDMAYVKQTISKNGLLIFNPDIPDAGKMLYSGGQDTTTTGVNQENATFEIWMSKKTSHQAKILAHEECEDGRLYCYLSGDITNAYHPETVDFVMRSTMSIETGDAKHPLLFLVYDRVTSKNADFKKSFMLHVMNEPKFFGGVLSADGEYTVVKGADSFCYDNTLGNAGAYEAYNPDDKFNGRLTSTTLLPECPEYSYIGGDGKRFWLRDKNMCREGDPILANASEIGWGRVAVSPTEKKLTDSFLHVMYIGDAKDKDGEDTECELIPSTLIKCDTHEGAIAFGSCVMFTKTNERCNSNISFDTSSASGELNYYVTGLKAGTWCCNVDGADAAVNVGEDGGLAVFTAKAGVVTLTYKG